MKRATVTTEKQYQRQIFNRFAEALSEDGKTTVLTNREHFFLGFVISLADIPQLAGSGQQEVLGRIFLTHYASEAWRVRNDLPMAGNLIGLPPQVARSLPRPKEEFELSFHDSEIEDIDMGKLKRLAVAVAYDVEPEWPIRPWTEGNWHYQWTEKADRLIEQNRAYRDGEPCGYLSWLETQRRGATT